MNGTNLESQNNELNYQNNIDNSLHLEKLKKEFIVRGSIYHNFKFLKNFQSQSSQKNDNFSNELQNQGDLMNKPNILFYKIQI